MQSLLEGIQEGELGPLPGISNRALGAEIVMHAFPNSYSTLPKLQQAIVRYKWHHGIHKVVQDFRTIPELQDLTRDPETGQMAWISQNGVITACKWFVRGVPWHPGSQGGRCAMVNLDQVMDLRNHLRDHGWMHREDLAAWLLQRRRERFTPQMKAVLARLLGETVAERECAMLDQDDQRFRSWAKGGCPSKGLNLKRARKLEAARWQFATKGTIGRWPMCSRGFVRRWCGTSTN
jgi:hypothetical protein